VLNVGSKVYRSGSAETDAAAGLKSVKDPFGTKARLPDLAKSLPSIRVPLAARRGCWVT
jgi:hypothetical protein